MRQEYLKSVKQQQQQQLWLELHIILSDQTASQDTFVVEYMCLQDTSTRLSHERQ